MPGEISRGGFDLGGRLDLPGQGWVTQGSSFVVGHVAYADGSALASGLATVGQDGVAEVGQTFLYVDGVYGPGVGTSTADNFLESSARVTNNWATGAFGYGERFQPFGPDGPKAQASVSAMVEGFDQGFSARSKIFDPVPLTLL